MLHRLLRSTACSNLKGLANTGRASAANSRPRRGLTMKSALPTRFGGRIQGQPASWARPIAAHTGQPGSGAARRATVSLARRRATQYRRPTFVYRQEGRAYKTVETQYRVRRSSEVVKRSRVQQPAHTTAVRPKVTGIHGRRRTEHTMQWFNSGIPYVLPPQAAAAAARRELLRAQASPRVRAALASGRWPFFPDLRARLVGARDALGSYAKTNKYTLAVLIGSTKAVLADYLVQQFIEEKVEIDWRRNAAFGTFGVVYLGGIQAVIYYRCMPKWFPAVSRFVRSSWSIRLTDFQAQRAVLAQTVLDLCVITPVLYMPTFYAITRNSWVCPDGGAVAVWQYPQLILDDMTGILSFWGPIQLINFGLLPLYCRVPFMAAAGLFWMGVLSLLRGSGKTGTKSATIKSSDPEAAPIHQTELRHSANAAGKMEAHVGLASVAPAA